MKPRCPWCPRTFKNWSLARIHCKGCALFATAEMEDAHEERRPTMTAAATANKLTAEDWESFGKLRIPEDIILAAKITRVSHCEAVELGIGRGNPTSDMSGRAIPVLPAQRQRYPGNLPGAARQPGERRARQARQQIHEFRPESITCTFHRGRLNCSGT